MSTMDVTVRLQALNGAWETCGADRMIGVLPESEQHTHNGWGPDKASFTLKRPVFAIWPDLGAFTPVEIEIGGVVVWEGRTDETPIKAGAEQQINVQCEGWQYHLDDDALLKCYVHSKLTDWKDARSFLEADLTRVVAAPTVGSTQGVITLGWPNGSPVALNNLVAVTLDLGPGAAAKRVVIDLDPGTVTDEPIHLYVWGSNTPAGWVNAPEGEAINNLIVKTGAGLHAGTFATACRYVTIFLIYTGGGGTYANDQIARIKKALVFGETAYESGNESALLASTIVPDVLERGTLLLSSDYSGIGPTSFHVPDFVVSTPRTPRELIEAANAYHNWITKLGLNRRFLFEARPTAPVLESGAWSEDDTEDNAANSGAEIYNRALVEAQGPDGSPMIVERAAVQQPGVVGTAVSAPAPENGSFTTNTEHWTASAGALTRDTGVFHSAPAGGNLAIPNFSGPTLTTTFSGTFQAGVTYLVSVWLRNKVGDAARLVTLQLGTEADNGVSPYAVIGEPVFKQVTVAWTPAKDRTGVTLKIAAALAPTGSTLYVDDVTVAVAAPTLVDRRKFRRTKIIQVSPAITAVEGQQLADIFLQSHITTPFKGSETVRHGAVRRLLGGQPVHPSQLGLYTQQLIRLSNLVDPDTGGIGRDGTIAEVSYSHKDQSAAVTLDDKRGNFEALLNRLAVVQTPGS